MLITKFCHFYSPKRGETRKNCILFNFKIDKSCGVTRKDCILFNLKLINHNFSACELVKSFCVQSLEANSLVVKYCKYLPTKFKALGFWPAHFCWFEYVWITLVVMPHLLQRRFYWGAVCVRMHLKYNKNLDDHAKVDTEYA